MSKSNDKDHSWSGDAFWGQGGSYIVDPATGKRRPRTPADDVAAADPAAIPAATGQRPDGADPGTQIEPQGLAPINTLKEKRRG